MLYRYEAVTLEGELLRGEMDAADPGAVVARLQQSGHVPISATRAASKRKFRLSRSERGAFTRELASLVHAGLPLDRALQVIAGAAQDAAGRSLAAALQEAVRGGAALSEALAAREGAFDAFYVGMVRAAEAAGDLDAGLARLAEHEERAKALRDSVVSALIYPAILVAVAAASLLLILAYVVPQFAPLFADAGQALPWSTAVVLGVAGFLRDFWFVVLVIILSGSFLLKKHLNTAAGRYRRDSLLLRLPLAGELERRVQMARLARSLAALLESGVPLLAALGIAKELLSNRVLADALDLGAAALKAGGGLAAPLLSTGLFPPLGLQMIRVGEETGQLEDMLRSVAQIYEREVAAALQRLLALLEPLLIVGLGALIAGIVMSLLTAIVAVNDLPL